MSRQLYQYQQQASLYRAALLLGIVSGDVIISWADGIIANDADAPPQLFDLAMIPPSDLSELRHALQPLAAHNESVLVIRALFDIVQGNLLSNNRNAEDSITVLAQARRFLVLPGEYADAIATLHDDFMLAEANVIGDTAAVEARVRSWLSQFAGGEAAFLEESVR